MHQVSGFEERNPASGSSRTQDAKQPHGGTKSQFPGSVEAGSQHWLYAGVPQSHAFAIIECITGPSGAGEGRAAKISRLSELESDDRNHGPDQMQIPVMPR